MTPKKRVKRDILLEINEFTGTPINEATIDTLWESLRQDEEGDYQINSAIDIFMWSGIVIDKFITIDLPYKNNCDTQVRAVTLTDKGWVGWFCFYDYDGHPCKLDEDEWLDSIFGLKRLERSITTTIPVFIKTDE